MGMRLLRRAHVALDLANPACQGVHLVHCHQVVGVSDVLLQTRIEEDCLRGSGPGLIRRLHCLLASGVEWMPSPVLPASRRACQGRASERAQLGLQAGETSQCARWIWGGLWGWRAGCALERPRGSAGHRSHATVLAVRGCSRGVAAEECLRLRSQQPVQVNCKPVQIRVRAALPWLEIRMTRTLEGAVRRGQACTCNLGGLP